MMSIKISKENYEKLCSLSGKLRETFYRPVSINDAISFLYNKRKLSDLAGGWEMSDKEVTSFMNDIKKGWKNWKIKSV